MTREEMISHLRAANAVAHEAVTHGHHPFGAILIGPDDRILMRQVSLDGVRHAESELARRAAATYNPDFLWRSTLVATFEPCAMCAGTIYWANIGRVIYGAEESKLLALTGDSKANPTLSVPSRSVLFAGKKTIEVFGPFPEIEDELIDPHRDFWASHP
jgi:tRNA(Arg) A34 adenosine deaminase TadA